MKCLGTTPGIYLYGAADALIVGNTVHGNTFDGIYVDYSTRTVVDANEVYGNSIGILVAHSGDSIVRGNRVHDNYGGINASALVTSNEVYGNTSYGISAVSTAVENVVYGNDIGILGYAGSVVEGNRVYDNTSYGIRATTYHRQNMVIRGNQVYSNSIGIGGSMLGGYVFVGQIENNLVYANTNCGIQIESGYGAGIVNNTVYQPVGDAVHVEAASSNVTLRNNVLWVEAGYDISVTSDSQTGFASEYNLLHQGTGPAAKVGLWGTAQADTLADWQAATSQDVLSEAADPLFLDINGADDVFGYDPVDGDGGSDNRCQLLCVQSTRP